MLGLKCKMLSLGAGVQSSTLALLYETGELPDPPDFAIFADTHAEPKEVYDHLNYLKKIITKFPIYLASGGELSKEPHMIPFFVKSYDTEEDYQKALVDYKQTKKEIRLKYWEQPIKAAQELGKLKRPRRVGMGFRECTSNYKIRPLDKRLRELLGYAPRKRMRHKVTKVMGISFDEKQRCKDPKQKWAIHKYPLVEMEWTREDCLKWYEEKGFKPPPRSACIFCPYKSDSEWRHMIENSPEEFEKACDYDDWLRTPESKSCHAMRGELFVHSKAIPLRDIDFYDKITSEEDKINGMNNECDGMCGV